jgi:hypothetical protein
MCHNEIGLCACYTNIIPCSTIHTIARAYVITWREKIISTLTSFSFCISTPFLKVEMRILWFSIAKRMKQFPNSIQGLNLSAIVPTIPRVAHPQGMWVLFCLFFIFSNFYRLDAHNEMYVALENLQCNISKYQISSDMHVCRFLKLNT